MPNYFLKKMFLHLIGHIKMWVFEKLTLTSFTTKKKGVINHLMLDFVKVFINKLASRPFSKF